MAEPAEIFEAVRRMLEPAGRPLAGRKVLITAGPTREPIDPVRFISNQSSGKQGYALAAAAVELGAETVLISGPVNLPVPQGAGMRPVETAEQMLAACRSELPCDIAIFAAAVSDWRVGSVSAEKLKKSAKGPPDLKLVENPDILRAIAGAGPKRPMLVVGFAAETGSVMANALEKLKSKGCDLIVANDVSPERGVFGSDRNTVHLISADGIETWPEMTKREVARRLMEHLASRLKSAAKTVG
jgi:phosphopantothenoylcysteine decarboxylase/phosphopantothenate--cysteine ligase